MIEYRESTAKKLTPEVWSALSEEKLRLQRICNLGLPFYGTVLERRCKTLYGDLEKKGLLFRPRIFFGDEWFSPEGMNAIAIPFYFGHPRLLDLEKKYIRSVEGETKESFLRLLRHEAGHCFDHCYRFSKRKKWRELFGSPSVSYHPENYKPNLRSRNYVKNLEHGYAQAHPDEDFAETFAVWLDPSRRWRKEYRNWPVALKKLEYIEELVQESLLLPILAEKGRLLSSAASLKSTLEKYYQRRTKQIGKAQK